MTLDLDGLRAAITEARVLQVWRGQPAPLDALDAPLVRRRLLTTALETRVMRLEVAKRGLGAPEAAVARAIANAAEGRGPEAPRTGPLPPRAALTAALTARYGVGEGVVRRVARDLLDAPRLAEALLDEVDEAALKQAWIDASTEVVLDVVTVPRVPSTHEIDAAVRSRGSEIDAWYAAHRSRFNRPDRARVHRIFLEGDDAATQQRIEALRDRIEAGEPFEAVARAHSQGPQARQGGRVGALKLDKLPQGDGLAPGRLTVVRAEPGGFAFYRVDDIYPAVERPSSLSTVRREIAATLLREGDDLPAAKAAAEAMVGHLRAAAPGVPEALRPLRVTRQTTPPFTRGGRQVVPGLGLAPAVFDAAFSAKPGGVIGPLPVRQAYVVGRVVRAHTPDPAQWPSAKAAFVETWRAAAKRSVIDRWLSARLEGESMWIATDRLMALPRAALIDEAAPVPDGAGPTRGVSRP